MNQSELVEQACRQGNCEAVAHHLTASDGWTSDVLLYLIYLAAPHPDCVQVLLQQSNHDQPNNDFLTSLRVLGQHGHMDIIQRLLQEPSFSLTSVWDEVLEQPAILREVLEDARMPVRLSNHSLTLLHRACQRHKAPVVDLIARHPRTQSLLHAMDGQGQSALYMAAGGLLDDEVVQALLRHGADPALGCQGVTPLHRAVQSARRAQVQAVLACQSQKDGLLNTRDDQEGRTPLMMACNEYWLTDKGGDMREVVELLLRQSQVDVNAVDHQGWTVLHRASRWGLTWLVQLVLQQGGVDINLRDQDGQTALHVACDANHLAIVQVLVQGGSCLVTPVDTAGRNPLTRAVFPTSNNHCVQLLYYVLREHHGWMHLVQAS